MDKIRKLYEQIQKETRKKKMRRALATTMTGVIVFSTTYSLILPAITAEYETVANMPGMNLVIDEEQNSLPDAEAGNSDSWQQEQENGFPDGLQINEIEEVETYQADEYLEEADFWNAQPNGEPEGTELRSDAKTSADTLPEGNESRYDGESDRGSEKESESESEFDSESESESEWESEFESESEGVPDEDVSEAISEYMSEDMPVDTSETEVPSAVVEKEEPSEGENEEQKEAETQAESGMQPEVETEEQKEAETQAESGMQSEGETEEQTEAETQAESGMQPEGETEEQTEAETQAESGMQPEGEIEEQTEAKTQAESGMQPDGETESQTWTAAEAQTEIWIEASSETEVETQTESETEEVSEIEARPESETEKTSEIESEIQTEIQPKIETESESESEIQTEFQTEILPKYETETDPESESEIQTEIQTEILPKFETETESESESEMQTEFQTEILPKFETETEIESESEIQTEFRTEIQTEILPKFEMETESESENEIPPEVESEYQTEDVSSDIIPNQPEKGVAGESEVRIPDSDLVLHITYGAEAGIPADAEFKAELVNDETYGQQAMDLVRETISAEQGGQLALEAFFDLTIYADGNVMTPLAPVTVRAEFTGGLEENETIYAVHFPGTGVQPQEEEITASLRNTAVQEKRTALKARRSSALLAGAETESAPRTLGEIAQEERTDAAATDEAESSEAEAVGTEGKSAQSADGSNASPELIQTSVQGNSATFQAAGFSYYALVSYTVDFHYEVKGKMYEFSIPGGGFVSLEHVVEVLDIARIGENKADFGENEAKEGENALENGIYNKVKEPGVETIDENTGGSYEESINLNNVEVSEAAKKFVADVASVEFNSPELVWVGKVDEETSVGGLKEANGLEVQYSAELTEEQIAEINSSTVEAGDWALISVLPFTSEETLMVTMKNGDQFVVKVTDAQISKTFITASGETYEVTVTYGPEAKIPDNSELEVTELEEDSEEFQKVWKLLTGNEYSQSDQAYAQTDEEKTLEYETAMQAAGEGAGESSEDVFGMEAFDISIVDENGVNIEPQSSVKVSFTLKSLPEDAPDYVLSDTMAMHHVKESSEEAVVERVAAADGSTGSMEVTQEFMMAEFTVDSFSTYAITWGSPSNTSTNLLIRQNNTNRVSIPVYYVDTEGNAIRRPSGIGASVYANANGFPYTYTITTDNLAQDISGFVYQGAHSGSYQGNTITSVTASSNTYWGRTYYSSDVETIYLVYSGVSARVTVHYGYMSGGTFVEFTEEEDGDVPAGTVVPGPTRYGDQWDLEKTIPGYRYVTSRLNDPISGREISSLLNTDPPYKANTNNTFENADQAAYPSYTSSTAPTSFVSNWRYRQLSSSDWNPTGDGWNYSATEPVTGLGVTKPVSFSESDKDIYVIYEKGSMVAGNGEGDDQDLGELNAPTTDKQVDSNHDGTYDVTLSAKGEKKNKESSTKANVVIILDTSWSMYEKDAGDGQSRLSVAKSAIGTLADKLFALNAKESDTIELAFVNFAQRVRNEEEMRTIYSGTDATSFKNMINGLDCASGTNWDDALYAADHIYFNDNDSTYVVFVTDGDPISCAHPYGIYSDWDGGTYYTGRSNYEYALAAKNQADLIIAHNKTLYTIGAFGEIANLEAIGGTYLGQANDTAAINKYFDNIISDIQSALGYQDITINDGITALSSTGLARGDISSLRYYRSGGENTDGSEKYDHTANNGHGVEWEDAPEAYLLEVKSENGVTKYYKNGTEVLLRSLTELTEEEYLEKYPIGTRTVIWEINANSEELLEDGVTYTMIFTMWPSQEAYDLIADLNNGVIDYDEDLSQAEKDQVYLGDDNVYYLKTNTKATVDYTSVKLVNGEVSGTPTAASAEIEDPKGKMNLDTNIMTVSKEFAHLINEADPYEKIVFYLLVDGKYYNADGTLSDTLDESKVYAINLPKDGKWEDTIYIAPGLMRGGDILETGHNYSLAEKIISGNPYEYEFAPQTVRPMVITAVPTFLVKKDSFNTNTENKQEYTFNDTESTYVVVNGKSDSAGTYYAVSENDGSLTGVNHKTSELDITKIINDPQNLLTEAQEAAETFTYRVTLQIPDGCDPSGIVGYEYVPRTQSNAYTLFGYQTGQSAYAEDIERFSGKTYRAWNTLVYDALIKYDRVTENGNSFIKVRRDEDGNIIWKVPASNGYHTITYDMTLKQDEVIRFTNLPTGTKYTIQEIYANKYPADNAGGKTDGRTPVEDESNLSAEGYEIEKVQHTGGTLSADQTTVEGTIEAPDTRYYNQFTNKKVTESEAVRVELKVKKVVEDYTWGQEYYRFTLTPGTAEYTDSDGETGTSPMPDGTKNSVVSIYNSTADHTLSFGTIRYTRPGTYIYTVSEYDNTRNMPEVQFASPVTLTVTVTADESGKLTVEKVEDNQGTTVYTAETGSALAAGLTTQTNTTKKIHIRKVDKNNPNAVLADAVFEIHCGGVKMYLQDGKLLNAESVQDIIGMSVSADGAEEAMAGEKISSTFTLGEIDISGFSYDVVYELKEITPPDGYIVVNGHTYFKAVHDNTQTYVRLTDQNGTELVDENSNPILDNDSAAISDDGMSVSVKNEPGAALPNTGGPGTTIFYMIGLLLMSFTGMGILMKRRYH